MTSFIISGKNKEKRDEEINKLCKTLKISQFDISVIEHEKAKEGKEASKIIGISEVKTLQSKLYLKPYKSKQKALILEITQTITVEAQNSLLKVLEEPPEDTIIILSIPNARELLPTILSRCEVIETKHDELTEKESNELLSEFSKFVNSEVGERLAFAQQKSKDKQETLEWLLNLIKAIRKQLHENIMEEKAGQLSMEQYLEILQKLNQTYTIIYTTNVNLRFSMENLFLNLPHK